jgi:hypothetical protein
VPLDIVVRLHLLIRFLKKLDSREMISTASPLVLMEIKGAKNNKERPKRDRGSNPHY